MKQITENISNILEKLKRPQTAILFILISGIAYSMLALTANFPLLQSYLAELNFKALYSLAPSLILGYPGTVGSAILTLSLTTALLIGLNISLLTRILTAQGATGGLTGSVLGLSVSGCAACTTGVISLAGLSIGLGFLPFNGLELNFLGIILLGYTSLYISEKDRRETCKI